MTQWEIGYQLPFADFDGQQYCVYIYDSQGIPAEIVTLTGSEEPFVTQEDDDDDIFKNIRSQSGYLRIIDEDGTLMEQLFANNCPYPRGRHRRQCLHEVGSCLVCRR